MTNATPGFFISFEGGEGAGKSTQIARLGDWLQAEGHEVVLTREPGGAPGAEAVRDLLVSGDKDRWSPLTEALLVYAARRDHLEKTILPALATGKTVITDRFNDSSMAYQAFAGGLDRGVIETLNSLTLGGASPDLTFILDIAPEAGLKRAAERGGAARFEAKGLDFHEKVRQGFLKIAEEDKARCVVLDATAAIDDIAASVQKTVRKRMGIAE